MKLADLGAEAAKAVKGRRTAVVTDSNVADFWLDQAAESLEKAGFQVSTFVVPAGEETKNGETWLSLESDFADIPLTRTDSVVALGGGMIGDLAGFAAATYLRGIPVIQVPTSLLAAVDSSVGGKTAINLPEAKNQVGAFHMPVLVLQDPALLSTIPEEVFLDGMGETIKYGMIADEELFEKLRDTSALKKDPEPFVTRCVEIKTKFVEEDEFDFGLRRILNFGHTIGHAVEQLSGYSISHGRCVVKGMVRMTDIAVRQGWCEPSVKDRLVSILTDYGYDLTISYTNDQLLEVMKNDKKRESDQIELVAPERVGRCVLKKVSIGQMAQLLRMSESPEA